MDTRDVLRRRITNFTASINRRDIAIRLATDAILNEASNVKWEWYF